MARTWSSLFLCRHAPAFGGAHCCTLLTLRAASQIASEYPQAAYYPFRMTAEALPAGKQSVIAPLRAKLSLPHLDAFVKALSL